MKSFSRFAGDQEKEWVKQLDEHMETKPPPLPMIQAAMSIDQRATAFGFPKKPNFRVNFVYLRIMNPNAVKDGVKI